MHSMETRPSSSRPQHRPAHPSNTTSTPPRAIGSRSSSRTALQGSHYHIEPPSTPLNRNTSSRFNKGKGAATTTAASANTASSSSISITAKGRQQQTGPGRQTFTFLEDHGSAIEDRSSSASGSPPNHPRALSWSSVTQDSVVDNLLLSFDRMPGMDMFAADEVDDFDNHAATPPRVSNRMPQRARGHTYSSSLSTDMASVEEDSDSVYSRAFSLRSRGQRSSSSVSASASASASFRDSPAHMAYIREGRDEDSREGRERDGREARPRMLTRSSSETARTARNHASAVSSRAATMKSNAGSKFDYGFGQLVSTNKDGRGLMAHAPAKDHHFREKSLKDNASIDSSAHTNAFTQSAPDVLADSILSRGRPVPSQYSSCEMPCPEPSIPSGPGPDKGPNTLGPPGQASGPSTSQSSLTALPKIAMHRLAETLPLSQSTSHSTLPNQEIPQAIRDQASDFVRASNMRTASPSLVDQQAGTALSPAVSVGQTPISANDTPQQRPGFFRRVFGSSNRSSAAAEMEKQLSRESSVTAQEAPQPPRKKSLPNPAHHIASQVRPASTPKPSSSPAPGVINKKASSFFRRRKRSVVEDSVPPALPPHILSISPDAEPSEPAVPSTPGSSSLRKALDPYMVATDATPPSGQVPLSRFASESPGEGPDADSDVELFHSGYTPPPDATLRRNPLERFASPVNRSSASDTNEGLLAPKPRTPPDPDKLQVLATQKESKRPVLAHLNSFLSDTSDDERSKTLSVISAMDDTYDLPGARSPVSPMHPSPLLSPMSEVPHGESFFASPSTIHSDHEISPGATIRAVASHSGNDDEYGVTETKGLAIRNLPRASTNRLWLDSTGSYEEVAPNGMSLPLEVRVSPRAARHVEHEPDSKGSLPVVEVNGNEIRPSVDIARQLEAATSDQPAAEDKERARKIYAGEEDFIPKLQAAAWLGEKTAISGRTLVAYMNFYDMSGQNILNAMRSLCEKLTLKGESQQVDRILEAFACRWHECNPNNGFKGPGVVHNICYALLLLNTDNHIANIQHKMTRSEFVKNTMPAITDAAEKTIKPASRQNTKQPIPWPDQGVPDSPTMPSAPQEDGEERTSNDFKRSMRRISMRPGMGRNETDPGPGGVVNNYASNLLINFAYEGSQRGWLMEIETVLKSFYNSIIADALPLHGANEREPTGPLKPSNTLSANGPALRRTGSVISKAPSEGYNYRSRKVSDNQSLSHRWQSKNRPRPKLYPASTVGGSSRTSLEDGNSVLSPAASSMWSRISTGRTQPTMSVESFATHDFKQSLGFTNALSQAIIREETISDSDSFHRVGSLLEDESLELAGAPWAKEGMVKHKHHLEGPEKKAKERSWHECFAVVEKGYVHLFAFNRNSTKIGAAGVRARRNTTSANKTPSIKPSIVGGGNWTDNAEELGQFLLRQTIATTLPQPGYSKARPHVWALSLPTGAVHLFQVGTAEIAEEFASTVNYWSARLSKEPLVGGVDNIEYGWSDNILNPALLSTSGSPPSSRGGITSRGSAPSRSSAPSRTGASARVEALTAPVRSGTAPAIANHSANNSLSTVANAPSPAPAQAPALSRPSMQSSIRTSLDQQFGGKTRMPGDKAIISDWRSPAASMLPSQLLEIDQLRSLKAYITSVESELEKHNDLRTAIPLAYSGSSTKLSRVMGNWEKKSSYLLREVIKFRTYIEALEKAVGDRERVYEERRVREEEDAAIKKRRQMGVPAVPAVPA